VNPKRQLLTQKNTSYDAQIVKIGPPIFLAQLTFFCNSQILCFSIGRHPKSDLPRSRQLNR